MLKSFFMSFYVVIWVKNAFWKIETQGFNGAYTVVNLVDMFRCLPITFRYYSIDLAIGIAPLLRASLDIRSVSTTISFKKDFKRSFSKVPYKY